MEACQNYLFVEQEEGYVKAMGKSTSRVLSWREVLELCSQNDYACRKRLNVVLKVLSFVCTAPLNVWIVGEHC
jgi:hypothetical protein